LPRKTRKPRKKLVEKKLMLSKLVICVLIEMSHYAKCSDIDGNGISDAIEPLINNEMRFNFQPYAISLTTSNLPVPPDGYINEAYIKVLSKICPSGVTNSVTYL
jgi:hypothetical protein